MIDKIESITALNAKEFSVNPGTVPIITANYLVIADGKRRFAAVGAVRANGSHVLHLPRPRLVTVDAAGQRSHGTDVDTHPALVANQVVARVGPDFRKGAAIDHPQRAHSHAFVANSHAAVAEDAARRVEEHDW